MINMFNTFTIFFIIISFIIFYIYFGYPLLLLILSKFYKITISRSYFEPSVTLIVAAYNEDLAIRDKIKNSLGLKYPKEKLQVIIASDGSTDKTNEICAEYKSEGIVLVRNDKNDGKASVQNKAMKYAWGEIVIFTDATTILSEDAIIKVVENFADKSIGGVRSKIVDNNYDVSSVSFSDTAYWNYEEYIQKKESDLGILCMASGCFFAFRKELFSSLDFSISEDFYLPMKIVLDGFKIILDERIVVKETFYTKTDALFFGKKRTILLDTRTILMAKEILNPFKWGKYCFVIISHKILRWLIPYFLMSIFFVNLFLLENYFFQFSLIMQLSFYTLALIGCYLNKKGKKNIIFFIPYYFCLVNIAAMISVFQFINMKKIAKWIPQREK